MAEPVIDITSCSQHSLQLSLISTSGSAQLLQVIAVCSGLAGKRTSICHP